MALQRTLLRRRSTEASAKVEGYGGQARSASLRSPLSFGTLGAPEVLISCGSNSRVIVDTEIA